MKRLFQSHIPYSDQEIKKAWGEAIIVFDANTILNLYRYSDKSRSEFISLLRNLRQRIWTPEQAAHEYFKNRSAVIGEQAKSYESAKKSINDLRDALRKDRGHPFIGEKTMDSLSSILKNVEAELDENKEKQFSRIPSDEIMAEIVDIFDGRVGGKMSEVEFEAIFEEGSKRFEQKVPPGYKDAAKHDNPKTFAEKRSVFGDLIVWKQIIAMANELKKPVIFVTDDAKDDWWLESQGKTIGPRIELLDEFHEKVGQKLYMYRPDQFLKHAKEKLDSKISGETIAEIRATDEVRVSIEEERAASLILDRLRWRKNRFRDFEANIPNGITRHLDGGMEIIPRWRRSNGFTATNDSSWEGRIALHHEYEVVTSNIEKINAELHILASQLSAIRDQGNFESDAVELFEKRREELEVILHLDQQKLEEIRRRIEL